METAIAMTIAKVKIKIKIWITSYLEYERADLKYVLLRRRIQEVD